MKSAYLYVRVSTDEQKRKGYSLPEQEDRLLKYCESRNIELKGIFREDFSAKNFNRPKWKKLIATIKKGSSKTMNNILFIKWDRFSRNIEYAYEMIGILRKYNAIPMAIDQPIDFDIPESTVMLAVYLAVPEAENTRRSLNTSNGMRRAKLLGRHPNKAPMGYINSTGSDGKKHIVPQSTEACIVKWSFEQLSKNAYTIEDVRRMANTKGLRCSKSQFWKIIRNPVYCGYISFLSKEDGERQLIRGIHEPILSEDLFNEVQNIIGSKRKVTHKKPVTNEALMLGKYLICPTCRRELRASLSSGRSKKYPYYHCSEGCKVRFNADVINKNYENKLQKLKLSPSVIGLFNLILEDVNIHSASQDYLREKRLLEKQIADEEFYISKARKLFVLNKIGDDDFNNIRKEHQELLTDIKHELDKILIKLSCLDKQLVRANKSSLKIFAGFADFDVNDKKFIINQIPPIDIDISGSINIKPDTAISKILKTGR